MGDTNSMHIPSYLGEPGQMTDEQLEYWTNYNTNSDTLV
jgi:hypothetical protein